MIRALLRLPAMTLDHDALVELGELVDRMDESWTVLVGDGRSADGAELDAFVLASAVAAHGRAGSLGVAAATGSGRVASLLARAATTTQLLGGCEALLLEGDAATCRDAAEIIEALFVPGAHTIVTATASITEAVNDPPPSLDGGPAVLWEDDGRLCRRDGARTVVVGDVLDVELPGALPAPAPSTLVRARLKTATVRALAGALPA